MKIVRPLKVTPDEFFDVLEEALLSDITKATGEDVDGSVLIPGYTFVQYPDQASIKTTTVITAYDRGVRYASRSSSPTDTVELSYEIVPSESGTGYEVTFAQDIESFKLKRKGFSKSATEMLYLGKMSSALVDLQDKALDKREGIVRKDPKDNPVTKKVMEKASEKEKKSKKAKGE